jgi:hypothetical protein
MLEWIEFLLRLFVHATKLISGSQYTPSNNSEPLMGIREKQQPGETLEKRV